MIDKLVFGMDQHACKYLPKLVTRVSNIGKKNIREEKNLYLYETKLKIYVNEFVY